MWTSTTESSASILSNSVAKDYDVIMDKAAEAEELGLNNRHSTLEKLAALASAKEKCDAPECNPAGCRKVMAAYEL